jgi:hypothetical protein
MVLPCEMLFWRHPSSESHAMKKFRLFRGIPPMAGPRGGTFLPPGRQYLPVLKEIFTPFGDSRWS